MINLLFILFAIPALSMFIQKTYESGMIFRRLYLYFIYHYIRACRKKDRFKRFFIKPFICIYCFNTWITIFSYFIFLNTNLLFLPLFMGITYIILEMLLKMLWKKIMKKIMKKINNKKNREITKKVKNNLVIQNNCKRRRGCEYNYILPWCKLK